MPRSLAETESFPTQQQGPSTTARPNHVSPDRTLFGAMLLPESQAEQRNGQTQELWTQRCEERTCRSRSQRRSKTKRQTTTDCCDGTQNCRKRSRNACAPFQHALPSRASRTARRTSSTGGRPISSEPGYKRQLKAKAFACEESPATSRPLIRIVGDPENARSVAMLSSLTSTSRISAATPSESRTSLTNFHQEDITAGNNPQTCGFSRLFSNRAPTPARRGNSL
jgi:hypothetical protein